MKKFALETFALSHDGVLEMLRAAVACAEQIGQPQCIVIVDASGEPLAEIRMTGAKYLSRLSARTKARTAASTGAPSDAIPEAVRSQIADATQGGVTGLPGGLPIFLNKTLVGGIGVGSGSPEQDIHVAKAGLAAINATVR
ncbi:MAG: heme-binding protein [Pseudomonadota bacterium]